MTPLLMIFTQTDRFYVVMLSETKHLALAERFSPNCEIEILRCAQNNKLRYLFVKSILTVVFDSKTVSL